MISKNIIINFIIIFNIIFLNTSLVKAGEWKNITQQESRVLLSDMITDGVEIIYQNNKVDNKTKWNWVYNDSNSEFGWFAVQLYQLPNDWYINDTKAYIPKKQIKFIFGESYKFTSKRKGFKSHDNLANYRKFNNTENGNYCFVWGINFASDDAKWKEAQNPFAILDGFSCRSDNDFTNQEIERFINNIGAKDLREI